MGDYIPTQDAQAALWMRSFADAIVASPSTYELSSIDATTIDDAVTAFENALAISSAGATRTSQTIQDKDNARNAAETLVRQYAIDIKYNAAIDDGTKIAIGVRPVNNNRDPIYCPQTSPLLNIVAATPGAHTVRYADSFTMDSGAKPFGAAALQLYAYIGDEPTVDENLATFVGLYTRNPIAIAFTPEDDGKMATYFARWSGRRGDTGPFSLPVSMRIAA